MDGFCSLHSKQVTGLRQATTNVRFVLPPVLLLGVGGGLQGLLLGGGGELAPDGLQLGLGSNGLVLELFQRGRFVNSLLCGPQQKT